MVMVFHLFIGILPLGIYPVFGFYIISGYLMTFIMHENYGYTRLGRYSFGINRFLRLYPQYWAAAIISVVLIITLGSETVADYHPSMFLPASLGEFFSNVSMMFLSWFPNSVNPRLVPPTWSLTIEIIFYILICLGASKTFTRVKVWIFFSICYAAGTFIVGAAQDDRYFPVAAASLPFSIGSAIYFLLKEKGMYSRHPIGRTSAPILFILMLANCLVWTILEKIEIDEQVDIGFYLNIIIFTLLVYSLAKGGEIVNIKKSADKFIGDLSYPVYLLHWQAGVLVSFVVFGATVHEISPRGGIHFALSLLAVFMMSFLFRSIIDKPVQNIRTRIRENRHLHLENHPIDGSGPTAMAEKKTTAHVPEKK